MVGKLHMLHIKVNLTFSDTVMLLQWSYGVTCWEIFTVGKTPYPALDPPTLLRMLKEGHRLEHPDNFACSPEM